VAVIVPGWNSAAEVDDCLASLEGLDYPRERLELVWVDNGSTDGSPDRVEEHFRRMAPSGWRRLLLVRLPGNEGIPAAYNEGFARVSPDVFAVYRTETDVVHAPDCLARLVATLSGGESRGIVGVKVRRWPDGAEQCAAIRFDRWTGKVIPSFPKEPVRCEGVLGCAMLVRVAAIRRFPEFFHAPFRISGDEAELCLRFARAGYETWCDPAAEVFHKGGRSTGKVSDLARFYSIRNGVLIARRYAPGWVRPFRFAYHLAYAVKRLLGGDTLPARALLNAFGRGEAPPLPS
jgi:GT2 family glycosyltransferase